MHGCRHPAFRSFILMLPLFHQSLTASPLELRVAIAHRPHQALDPARAETEGEQWILKAFSRGLAQWGAGLTPCLDLAISLENPSNQRWVFHLRPEACWSNGEPIEAKNFIQSWSRLQESETPSSLQNQLIQLGLKGTQAWQAGKLLKPLGLHAPDAHTLILELEKPMERQELLAHLCHPAFFPIHPKTLQSLQGRPGAPKLEIVSNGLFIPFTQNGALQARPNPNFSSPNAISGRGQRVQRVEFEQPLEPIASGWSFWGKPSRHWRILEVPVEVAESWKSLPLKSDWGKLYENLAPQMLFLTLEVEGSEAPAPALLKLKQAVAIALTHPVVTYNQGLYRNPAYAPFYPAQHYHPLLPRHLSWSLERRRAEAQRLLEASGYEWNLWVEHGVEKERAQLQEALALLESCPKLRIFQQPPEAKRPGYRIKVRLHQTTSPDPSFEGQLHNWKQCLQLSPELAQEIKNLEEQRKLYTGAEQEDDRLMLVRNLEALFFEHRPCIPWLQRSRLFGFQAHPELFSPPLESCTPAGYPHWRSLMMPEPFFTPSPETLPQSWWGRWLRGPDR